MDDLEKGWFPVPEKDAEAEENEIPVMWQDDETDWVERNNYYDRL